MCEKTLDELKPIIEKYRDRRGALVPVLHEAQQKLGYLPHRAQEFVSEHMNIPLSEIYGVVTFYSFFSTTPKGDHTIGVCTGTACYVKGADALLDTIYEHLDIELGETSSDQRFTLTQTRCVAACSLAPVLMIDENVYGNLTAEDIPEILDRY